RREEDLHVLGWRRTDHRAELVGHLLLADEEGGQPVHAAEALLLGKGIPVGPVLREVDVLSPPLLPLPKLVELSIAEELHLAAVGGLLERGVRRLAEELALVQAQPCAHWILLFQADTHHTGRRTDPPGGALGPGKPTRDGEEAGPCGKLVGHGGG